MFVSQAQWLGSTFKSRFCTNAPYVAVPSKYGSRIARRYAYEGSRAACVFRTREEDARYDEKRTRYARIQGRAPSKEGEEIMGRMDPKAQAAARASKEGAMTAAYEQVRKSLHDAPDFDADKARVKSIADKFHGGNIAKATDSIERWLASGGKVFGLTEMILPKETAKKAQENVDKIYKPRQLRDEKSKGT